MWDWVLLQQRGVDPKHPTTFWRGKRKDMLVLVDTMPTCKIISALKEDLWAKLLQSESLSFDCSAGEAF